MTPQDMMHKQLTEPITRPETYVKSIPKTLSNILMKMVAKGGMQKMLRGLKGGFPGLR